MIRLREIRRFFVECSLEQKVFLLAIMSIGAAGIVLAPIAILRNL